MLLLWATLLAFELRDARACPSAPADAKPLSLQEWNAFKLGRKPRKPAAFEPSYHFEPWGGPNPRNWEPEAIVANAASHQLNKSDDFKEFITDEYVAIPVQILQSNDHPYGDGQTNSALALGTWPTSRKKPPLEAVLSHLKSGHARVLLAFDSHVRFEPLTVEIKASFEDGSPSGRKEQITLPARTIENDDHVVEWRPRSAPTSLWARPSGMHDWFPVVFKHPVMASSQLVQAAGKPLLDPEGIASEPGDETAFDRLIHHEFKLAYNATPYYNKNIHGEFPLGDGGKIRITGVSEGWTWLMQPPQAPLKILYTCFGGRRPDLEKTYGVPTSAGWHEIGDPVETIFNSLEKAPIPVGWGVKNPLGAPPSGGVAYGLSDTVTIRPLKPGEALMTVKGEFHWFAFPLEREVCTEEWVHPCVPTPDNELGLNCGSNKH
jgi:hypothetical protein